MRKSETNWQIALIGLGLIATLLFGIFFYRELFPEYRIYQDAFVELEKFREEITKEKLPPFKVGVKQIVIERDDKGPASIDRCTSCHVALQIEAYSKTRVAKDLNGNIILDKNGFPLQEENPDYIFAKLDKEGKERADYEKLKFATVGEVKYPMEKVLVAHPLMGKETRPFEYHPIEDYGCVSCHGGNGRGLVTDKAHGPYLDGQYEKEETGYVPRFLEEDPLNDPKFSKVFNHKPGHALLFQTTPLYVGALIEAKCIQCHQSSKGALERAKNSFDGVIKQQNKNLTAKKKSYDLEDERLASLLEIHLLIAKKGFQGAKAEVVERSQDFTLPEKEQEYAASQVRFLSQKEGEKLVQEQLLVILGDSATVQDIEKNFDQKNRIESLEKALKAVKMPHAGTIFEKLNEWKLAIQIEKHVQDLSQGLTDNLANEEALSSIITDIDALTSNYTKGKALFISQGCYACHRVAGFARGGVGPELTRSGDGYPWYVKESLVWPQADLKTSTMPNLKLDHEELEQLTTYLLGQTSTKKVLSAPAMKIALQEWEAGAKQPFEKGVSDKQIVDLNYGMTVFAVEGCASCHRLKGFTSNVGFKEENNAAALQKNRAWFRQHFPENITGSQLVKVIEAESKQIHERIIPDARKDSILEQIEKEYPGSIEALYSNFKFALRAKNHEGDAVSTPWQQTVRKVLMTYIQVYGLGRLICPKPSWSGIYRSDQWLLEHFKAPASHVPKSIMPAFPFDDSKYHALIYMLDTLGQKNVEEDHLVWKENGFKPQAAYKLYCAQCHGDTLQGNGPVSEWLYPIPKSLRKEDFLRNLTKEKAIESIMYGVPGTPMPPWGSLGAGKSFENKTPVLSKEEVIQLVDWIFGQIPGESTHPEGRKVPKWNYTPEDVLKELKEEGTSLPNLTSCLPNELRALQKGGEYFASLAPTPSKKLEVADLFDVVEAGPPLEKRSYYIKEKFYTPENIEAGRRFFYENCASCHGKEADGTGLRAEAMFDAKPRMLTNLDWISSRDDLRLIRSIKYGVPGTSMTPWGDLTSSLQRIQLVIFIRSLTEGKKEFRSLTDSLYRVFDEPETKDNHIKVSLKQLKDLYYAFGVRLLSLPLDRQKQEELMQTYIQAIDLYGASFSTDKEKKIGGELLDLLKSQVAKLEEEKKNLTLDNETAKALSENELNAKISSLIKAENEWIRLSAEAGRIRNTMNKKGTP